MLNSASIQTVNKARFSSRFVKPCYNNYCFANLPSTIAFLLTGTGQSALPLDVLGKLPTRYDKVIFFFIDAFGWKFFERYAGRYPFLKTIVNEGVASKLTSQFPSTTAAHVTCIHTGLDVGYSGVYEWHYYEPLVDEVITPLLFSYAGDKITRDTLKHSAISPFLFFPQQTFYHSLQAHNVQSHIFQYYSYATSTYSDVVFRGAQVHPYRTLYEALTQLTDTVLHNTHTPAYYFFYYDRIDATCHLYGPHARQAEAAIDSFLTMADEFFLKALQNKSTRTLLMMTADHGQTEVDPKTTFYLNRQIPGIELYFQTNTRGHPIVPAGSPRDMFLYVKEAHIDEVISLLQRYLTGKADIYRTRDLLDQQFFGAHPPSAQLLARLGNIVILPYQRETVWWHENGKFDMHFRGHHGGLLADEMEIPLLILPL